MYGHVYSLFPYNISMPDSKTLLVIAPNVQLHKILTWLPSHYFIFYRIHPEGLTHLFAEEQSPKAGEGSQNQLLGKVRQGSLSWVTVCSPTWNATMNSTTRIHMATLQEIFPS